MDGLREELAKTRFELEVQVSPASFLGKPDATLEKLAREKRDAAWVLLGAPPPLQHWFMERGLPCGLIGARHPGISLPSVGSDYHALGHHAAGQFLRRLHRQLVVLVPADDKAGHVFTIAGFRAACSQIDGAEMRVIQHDGSPAGIQRCLAAMLKHAPPTGLLVAMPKYALARGAAAVAALSPNFFKPRTVEMLVSCAASIAAAACATNRCQIWRTNLACSRRRVMPSCAATCGPLSAAARRVWEREAIRRHFSDSWPRVAFLFNGCRRPTISF
ncbi:MAG: LacI family DNA-binding transcriptional regulator [Verrucomicrobia bacterium]|nr:LacI family DNA-binding transcriptional regulator [Verrucomicrobiota bacterium]